MQLLKSFLFKSSWSARYNERMIHLLRLEAAEGQHRGRTSRLQKWRECVRSAQKELGVPEAPPEKLKCLVFCFSIGSSFPSRFCTYWIILDHIGGFPYVSMDFHGFPWVSHNFRFPNQMMPNHTKSNQTKKFSSFRNLPFCRPALCSLHTCEAGECCDLPSSPQGWKRARVRVGPDHIHMARCESTALDLQ